MPVDGVEGNASPGSPCQLMINPDFTLKWFCAGHLSAMAWFQQLLRVETDVWPLCMSNMLPLPLPAVGIPAPGYKSYLHKSPLSIAQYKHSVRGLSIPQVTIKTGLTTPDGREELLAEYFCDHPGCPNVATQVLGCVAELRAIAVSCDEHAPKRRS